MGWTPNWIVTRNILPDLGGQGGSPNPLNTKWSFVVGQTPRDCVIHPIDVVVSEPATALTIPVCVYNNPTTFAINQNDYWRISASLKGRDGTAPTDTTQAASIAVADNTYDVPTSARITLYPHTLSGNPTFNFAKADSIDCRVGNTTFNVSGLDIAATKWYNVGMERLGEIVNFFFDPTAHSFPTEGTGSAGLLNIYSMGPLALVPSSTILFVGFDLSGAAHSASDYSGMTNLAFSELLAPGGGGGGPGPGSNDMLIPHPGDTGPGPGGPGYGESPGGSASGAQAAAYRRYKNIRSLSNQVNNLTLGV